MSWRKLIPIEQSIFLMILGLLMHHSYSDATVHPVDKRRKHFSNSPRTHTPLHFSSVSNTSSTSTAHAFSVCCCGQVPALTFSLLPFLLFLFNNILNRWTRPSGKIFWVRRQC